MPRTKIRKFTDTLFFPIRAVFVPEESSLCFTSLRDERFEEVAKLSDGYVLDVGCGRGNLFIHNYIGLNNGVGIDIFHYEGVENIVEDMCNLPFESNSFDTITLIAVGGHIPVDLRKKEFNEFSRILKTNGRLIMTEGEPVTQTISHIWRKFSYSLIGKKDMDSERGLLVGEEYCMPKKELIEYLNTPPLTLKIRKKFMWGLNNIYVATKRDH